MRQKYPELAANSTINTNETSSSQVDFRTLNPRAVTMDCCPIAYDGYYLTGQHAAKLREGITYLQNHVGVCGAQAKQCLRISCSNYVSVVLCNLASPIPSLILARANSLLAFPGYSRQLCHIWKLCSKYHQRLCQGLWKGPQPTGLARKNSI